MTPAGQENTEPVVMPDDEVLYELADVYKRQAQHQTGGGVAVGEGGDEVHALKEAAGRCV